MGNLILFKKFYIFLCVAAFWCFSIAAMYTDGSRSFVFDGENRTPHECENVVLELEHAPSDLQAILLTNMRIGRLPKFLKKFTQLRILSFAGNCLKDNSVDILGNFKKLLSLDLSENFFKHVPQSVADLPDLCALNLSGNRLISAKAAWGNVEMLETLDLSCNDLKKIDSSVTELPELRTLILDGNLLRYLPTALSCIATLRKLTLTHNCFTKLPAVVDCLGDENTKVNVLESEDEQFEQEHPDDVIVHYSQITQHRGPREIRADRLV